MTSPVPGLGPHGTGRNGRDELEREITKMKPGDWTNADLFSLDAEFAKQGVAHHARPLRAAMKILGGDFVLGVLGNPETDKIVKAYRSLIPECDMTWIGLGVGLVASVDQVRKVTLRVPFGIPGPCHVWKELGFESEKAWGAWCRQDRDIAAGTHFAFADLHDLSHGLNSIEGQHSNAETLWEMARSNLEDTANTLPLTFSVKSVIQPICLTAELSMKALLVWNGLTAKQAGNQFGHKLVELAAEVAAAMPHRDDTLIGTIVSKSPPYVASRYSPAGLTRLTVVGLALAAQFITASTLRRVSGVDLAAQMETGGWPNPRLPPI
jgi:hypothetical protein